MHKANEDKLVFSTCDALKPSPLSHGYTSHANRSTNTRSCPCNLNASRSARHTVPTPLYTNAPL